MGSCNWVYKLNGESKPRRVASLNKEYANSFRYGEISRKNATNISVGDRIATNARGSDGARLNEKWNFTATGTTSQIYGGDVIVTNVKKTAKRITVEGRIDGNGSLVKKQYGIADKIYTRDRKK